jgi:hypothetical protein
MGKTKKKGPQSTIQKIMFVQSRLSDVHSQILELEQMKLHNMILLRDLGMENARKAREEALTPRLRKMLEDSRGKSSLQRSSPNASISRKTRPRG